MTFHAAVIMGAMKMEDPSPTTLVENARQNNFPHFFRDILY